MGSVGKMGAEIGEGTGVDTRYGRGSWFLVLGSWFLVLGSWFFVSSFLSVRTVAESGCRTELILDKVDFFGPGSERRGYLWFNFDH